MTIKKQFYVYTIRILLPYNNIYKQICNTDYILKLANLEGDSDEKGIRSATSNNLLRRRNH